MGIKLKLDPFQRQNRYFLVRLSMEAARFAAEESCAVLVRNFDARAGKGAGQGNFFLIRVIIETRQ
jgi:hypothetical protein